LKVKALKLVDQKKIYEDTLKILKRLNIDLSPKQIVKDLSIAQQQMVEIAKALSINARILIMDEPTSSLSKFETEQLFKILKELKSQGVSVIYISHRLGEVKEIADRIVALRDGCNSGELNRASINREHMVSLMVGRNVKKFFRHKQSIVFESNPIFEVINLITPKHPVHRINLKLFPGEILVLAGLVGAGRTELLHAIFGIDKPLGGKILIQNKPIKIRNIYDAIRRGIGLVPEDRKLNGLILKMAVEENITLAGIDCYQKMKLINFEQVYSVARNMVDMLKIRTPSIHKEVQLLSGGNQQKVVLAKWLSLNPRILLLDEPTRGLDILSKEEIYRLIEKLASEGVGILISSSDMLEVIGIADRILVMREGNISGELKREEFTEEKIFNMASGGIR